MTLFYFWLSAALISIILEIGHPGLFLFLSFAAGGALAAVAAWYYPEALVYQASVFLITSIVSFIIARMALSKAQSTSHHHTNIYALVGKHGMVVETISPFQPGYVLVGTERWLARELHNEILHQGTKVVVVHVAGASLIVKAE